MTTDATIEEQLTNGDLALAITWTSQRCREIAPDEPQKLMLEKHLQGLLDEQLRRATSAFTKRDER